MATSSNAEISETENLLSIIIAFYWATGSSLNVQKSIFRSTLRQITC